MPSGSSLNSYSDRDENDGGGMKRMRLDSITSKDDSRKESDDVSTTRSCSPEVDVFFPSKPIPRNKSILSCLSAGSPEQTDFFMIQDPSAVKNYSTTRSQLKSRLMSSWGWFVPVDK